MESGKRLKKNRYRQNIVKVLGISLELIKDVKCLEGLDKHFALATLRM